MYTFVELWHMNTRWRALSSAERAALFDRMGAITAPIIEAHAIEAIGWGFNDSLDEFALAHECFAIWRAPTREGLLELAKAIHGGGWYEYASQSNVFGELQSPTEVIRQLMSKRPQQG